MIEGLGKGAVRGRAGRILTAAKNAGGGLEMRDERIKQTIDNIALFLKSRL